jgi:hypothetical protein
MFTKSIKQRQSYAEPANAPHYVWAKDDDVIIQLTSIGPTRVTPVPH